MKYFKRINKDFNSLLIRGQNSLPITIHKTIAFPLVPNITMNVKPIVNTTSMMNIKGSGSATENDVKTTLITDDDKFDIVLI